MSESASQADTAADQAAPDQLFNPDTPFALKHPLPPAPARRPQPGRGRRSQTMATSQGGHYVRAALPQGPARDIALDATLRAAALRRASGQLSGPNAPVENHNGYHASFVRPVDLRVKVRRARTGNLILFVVDASGSMGARKRMVAVKGAILSLLLDAYQKRDRVGLISFRGQAAQLLVPPTNSVELAEQHLRQLPTGGRTPLLEGLKLADSTLTGYLRKDATLTPLLVLITDGRANASQPQQLRNAALAVAQKKIAALVLDSEQGFVRLGLARKLARWLKAEYLPLDELRAERLAGEIQRRVDIH